MRPAARAALVLAAVLFLAGDGAAQAPAPLPRFDQSRIYAREADFQRAIQPYQAAIAADARHPRAHYWLGVAHLFVFRQHRAGLAPYASGFLPRAVASLRQAVTVDPNFIPAYLALQDALVLDGKLAEAAAVLAELARRTRPPGPYTLPPP